MTVTYYSKSSMDRLDALGIHGDICEVEVSTISSRIIAGIVYRRDLLRLHLLPLNIGNLEKVDSDHVWLVPKFGKQVWYHVHYKCKRIGAMPRYRIDENGGVYLNNIYFNMSKFNMVVRAEGCVK
jgi:hypothetical protein